MGRDRVVSTINLCLPSANGSGLLQPSDKGADPPPHSYPSSSTHSLLKENSELGRCGDLVKDRREFNIQIFKIHSGLISVSREPQREYSSPAGYDKNVVNMAVNICSIWKS